MDKGVELLSLCIAECHNVFLYCTLFAAHVCAPSVVTQTSIQTTLAESMTKATSRELDGEHRQVDREGGPQDLQVAIISLWEFATVRRN